MYQLPVALTLALCVSAFFFGAYALGRVDGHDTHCYGQTIHMHSGSIRYTVSSFKVDDLDNHDVSRDFQIWFLFGFLLTTLLPALLLIWKMHRTAIYLASVLLAIWLTLGAYVRFREWGERCSFQILL